MPKNEPPRKLSVKVLRCTENPPLEHAFVKINRSPMMPVKSDLFSESRNHTFLGLRP